MKKKSLKIYIFFYYGECKPLLVKQETALVFATVPQNAQTDYFRNGCWFTSWDLVPWEDWLAEVLNQREIDSPGVYNRAHLLSPTHVYCLASKRSTILRRIILRSIIPQRAINKFEQLNEIWSKIRNISTRGSVAQVGENDEEKTWRKNLVRLSL